MMLINPYRYAGGGNGLLNNLVAYWKLDEASGTRVDSHGSFDLTDNNTVTSTTGKINSAAQFVSANSEYLSRAYNSQLSPQTAQDFSFSVWANLINKTNDFSPIWYFATNSPGGSALQVDYHKSSDRLRFVLFNVTTALIVSANSLGSPSTGTWYHIVGRWDSATKKHSITTNNGTEDVFATTVTAINNMTADVNVGAHQAQARYGDILIDEFGIWQNRKLTDDDVALLYNSGVGLAYESFTS